MASEFALMQLQTSFAVPIALAAVMKLGVPDIIAQGGEKYMSAEKIVSHLPCKSPANAAPMLKRCLLGLVGSAVFSEELVTLADGKVETVFGLTPISRLLLSNETYSPTASTMIPHIAAAMNFIPDAILSNSLPWVAAHGTSFYEYITTHPDDLQNFSKLQTDASQLWIKSFLKSYDGLKDANTLVDIGGGEGRVLGSIVAAYPHLRGVNFDLPQVVAGAPTFPGVRHVGGSYLEPGLPCGDIILLKRVLHNNDDATCAKILKNCFDALPSGGKLLIGEDVLSAKTSPKKKDLYHVTDLMMMTLFGEGQERTYEQFGALLSAAGFTRYSVVICSDIVDLVEAHKD